MAALSLVDGFWVLKAAGASGAEYLRFADATEIGSSGAISDSGDEQIDLAIADEQAAASGGLDGLIGAAVWDLGSTSKGNINCLVEWVSMINKTSVVIAIWRSASAPTSLADIDGANTQFLQILTRNTTPATSTYLKTGTNNLATLSAEGLTSSVSISYTVGTDADGWGGALSRHDGGGTSKTRTQSTSFAGASGTFYLALLWGKATASATEAETISIKLQGEFLH
jgi:hypothetical protein